MFVKRTYLFLAVALSLSQCSAEDVSEHLKAMEAKMEKLSKAVESQNKMIEEQKRLIDEQRKDLEVMRQNAPASQPIIDDMLKKFDVLEDKLDERTAQAIKIASRKKPNDLNMAIGAAVDTSFGYTTGKTGDHDRPVGNDFQLRGAELVFSMDCDPYFKSYMVVNAKGDAANNDEAVVKVEEAAIITTSLSYVTVKGGRFFAPFGRLSSIHDHDLPFTTRPRSLDSYVGGESAGDGVQVQALIPVPHFLQITGGVYNKIGANFPLSDGAGHQRNAEELTLFLKALTAFDFCTDSTLEMGASAIEVPDHAIRRDLTNLELTYKWHPKTGTELRQKLIVGAELMRNNLSTQFEINPGPPPVLGIARLTGYGGYGYAEYFHTRHWSMGGRIDLFQNVDPAQTTVRLDQTYTAFATYNFSEFSRLRFEASRHEYFNGHQGNEFLLQWTAFWGAHAHDFNGR